MHHLHHLHLAPLFAIVVALTACGSDPKEHQDETPATDAPAFKLAVDGAFGARLAWLKGPQTCTDADLQSTATLTLVTPDGKAPTTVTDLTVKPWMKVHGHGTGNWQPKITALDNRQGTYTVTDICFIMAGPWELNIEATVDGRRGTLEWPVDVP